VTAPRSVNISRKDPSVLLHVAVTLAMGFGLVALAVVTAVAAVMFPDTRANGATARTQTSRSRAWLDPNEAARAAGSWG
jgi:hypothetical protein